jgi:hypothetical protein
VAGFYCRKLLLSNSETKQTFDPPKLSAVENAVGAIASNYVGVHCWAAWLPKLEAECPCLITSGSGLVQALLRQRPYCCGTSCADQPVHADLTCNHVTDRTRTLLPSSTLRQM